VLSWTNPARYIDGNAATDLSNVRIIRNGLEVARVDAAAAGQPQSYSVDAQSGLNAEQTFAVRIESRSGRSSALSNSVSIRILDVPGVPGDVLAAVDQLRIRLSWQPPSVNSALAQSYIIRRSDRSVPWFVTGTSFDDREVEIGKSYVYSVTAALGTADPRIPGPAGMPVTVTAIDKTPPQAPSGLAIDPSSLAVGIGILTWSNNAEEDLAGYKVYRREGADGPWVLRTPMPISGNTFSDSDFRTGLYYRVTAVDLFDNESEPVQAGP
jgi:hypothetical protein